MRVHRDTIDDVLNLCNRLTKLFAQGPVLMPIVVLHAGQTPDDPGQPGVAHRQEPAGEASDQVVNDLYEVYRKGRVRCRRFPQERGQRYPPLVSKSPLPDPPDALAAYGEALTLVHALATPDGWDNADRSSYRPYTFPRSALLSAIEEAVVGSAPGEGAAQSRRPDQRAAFKKLNSLRPRKPLSGPLAALRSLIGLLAPLLAIVVTVELTTVSTPQRMPLIAFLTILAVAVVWGVLVFRQSLTAPLSGIFPASRWFATSTFILAEDDPDGDSPPRLEPLRTLTSGWSRRMRAVREERARMIVSQLSTAFYGSPSVYDAPPSHPPATEAEREIAMQLYLSLRVHALLEDLRANYQPWTLDLRRRKRRWPPILFLPGVDQQPGCVRFVQAVSDLRSRRSEADPLLILASSEEPLPVHPSPEPDDSRQDPYERWIGRLRIEQSPSQGKRLPWVLRQEVVTDSRLSSGRHDLPRATWSMWHLWSRWTAVFAVVLLCIGGYWRSQQIGDQYCGGWLFGHDPNLVLNSGECIGVETNDVPAFLPVSAGLTLSGAIAAPGYTPASGSPVSLSQVNLAYVEGLIDKQNQQAKASGAYITVVYAGALTVSPGSAPSAVTDPQSALAELAGVYAWQYYVNVIQGDHVKLRVDIANDGDGSAQELQMAQTVVAAANTDPSIKGVVGLDKDTRQAASAIAALANVDLPIIDTAMSDDSLPENEWNYFGMSPTNAEEAQSLVARAAPRGNGRYAAVFEEVAANGQAADPYTDQQAQSAGKYLAAAGFKLVGENGGTGPIPYTTQTAMDTSPDILQAVCADHPSVVYLAGRHGDMKQLVGLLSAHKQCFRSSVTVLSGDDMAISEYPGTHANPLAPEMTLYYVAQTDPAHVPAAPGGGASSADNDSGLNIDLQKALNLKSTPGYSNAVFGSGLMALGFDAADLLYNASITGTGAGDQEQAVSRAAVAPGLRCPHKPIVGNGATGPLGFADVRHGLDIFKAVNDPSNPNRQRVTFNYYLPTVPGTCAPNVKS